MQTQKAWDETLPIANINLISSEIIASISN